MKSKDLIALLQKEDPTGEQEVVMDDGRDIFFLERIPGYWDGCYTTLIRDPAKKPYYDIIGAKYRSDGVKIKIRAMGWDDVISEDADAPVEVIDCFTHKVMQQKVDQYRKECKEMDAQIKREFEEAKNEKQS